MYTHTHSHIHVKAMCGYGPAIGVIDSTTFFLPSPLSTGVSRIPPWVGRLGMRCDRGMDRTWIRRGLGRGFQRIYLRGM